MRALEAGMHIAVGQVTQATHGVDTQEDLDALQGRAATLRQGWQRQR